MNIIKVEDKIAEIIKKINRLLNKKDEDIEDIYFIKFVKEIFEKNIYSPPRVIIWNKVMCPRCLNKVHHDTYCSKCGQRIKKRNYIVVDEKINVGGGGNN